MKKKEITNYKKKLDSIFKVVTFLGSFSVGVFGIDIKSLSIINQSGKSWIYCSMFGLFICMILLLVIVFMYLSETNRIYK